MKNIPLLTPEDIEVKIKQVTKTGALALLYKTARVDRKILNQVYGPMNWTSEYKVVKDNLYCGIGIREESDQEFVWKWDCGIESREDDDGNEKKGEASDAFKRAGFAVGIGEELYSSPMIWLDVNTRSQGNKFVLEDPYAKYVVTHIKYNEKTRVITELEICNARTNVKVYSWSMPTAGAIAKKMVKTLAAEDKETEAVVKETEKVEKLAQVAPAKEVPATKPLEEPKAETSAEKEEAAVQEAGEVLSLSQLKVRIGGIVKSLITDGRRSVYDNIVNEIAGPGFKCNTATEEKYDLVKAIYKRLSEVE